ncbi:MAG: LysR substrate-binding domain-containing protein [Burkholderiaceae bacterium]
MKRARSAAADDLHLTHSALSQQIKLLEEQIGCALFDRRGRRIVLNAAGAALLSAIEPALAQIDDGVRAAQAAASGATHRVRLTVLPSFAQRWLLPRMGRWRERHPDIAIELHTSQQVIDLQRDGYHAAVRQGDGHWRGVEDERLTDSPLIAVGSPAAAERLRGRSTAAIADEPLLGNVQLWRRWFALSGLRVPINPVASFNDAGLMLQAVEQGLGIALARKLLAADALQSGRLMRLSPEALHDEQAYAYWFVRAREQRDWPPLVALLDWLRDELARSRTALAATSSALSVPEGTVPEGPRESRSRARSARPARNPGP